MEDRRPNQEYDDYVYLSDLFRTLWISKWFIIGATILVMLATALISKFCIQPVYEASAVVEISPLPEELSQIPKRSITSYLNLATSDKVLQRLVKELNLDKSYTYKELREKRVKTEVINDTNLLKITVNDNSPAQAAKMANQLAAGLITLIKQDQEKQLDLLIKHVDTAIAIEEQHLENTAKLIQHKLTGGTVEAVINDSRILRSQDILSDLEEQRIELESIKKAGIIGENILLVAAAKEDTEPVKPNIVLNTALAGLLAFMLAVFIVLFREYMAGSYSK